MDIASYIKYIALENGAKKSEQEIKLDNMVKFHNNIKKKLKSIVFWAALISSITLIASLIVFIRFRLS